MYFLSSLYLVFFSKEKSSSNLYFLEFQQLVIKTLPGYGYSPPPPQEGASTPPAHRHMLGATHAPGEPQSGRHTAVNNTYLPVYTT